MRSSLAFAISASLLCVGCFQFTQGPQGNLQSVGVPGATIWKSADASKPITPEQLGYSPEEAAKLGGPVLVEPADSSTPQWRYRFYYASNNQCAADLTKMLAARAQQNITGPAPYCTMTPPQPSLQGHGLLF